MDEQTLIGFLQKLDELQQLENRQLELLEQGMPNVPTLKDRGEGT